MSGLWWRMLQRQLLDVLVPIVEGALDGMRHTCGPSLRPFGGWEKT
jgi:hypothetical protein